MDNLPEDRRTWTDEQKADFAARQLPVYKVENRSSTTGDVTVLQVTGVYENHPQVNAKNIGARVKGLTLAGQTSFKVSGTQVDLCAMGSVGMVLGRLENNGSTSAAAGDVHAKVCGGVQVGQIARLGYDLDAHLQMNIGDGAHNALTIAQTASASKILGTPLQVGYTNEWERLSDNDGNKVNGIRTQIFTAGMAF